MQSAGLYTDFAAIADLRERAAKSEHAALDEVAAQFESLFIQMMLKSMRDATVEGGLFSSHQLDTYQQMHDQQLSLEMASDGGLGLTEVIVSQLRAAGQLAESTGGDGDSADELIGGAGDAPAISLKDIRHYLRNPLISMGGVPEAVTVSAASPGTADRPEQDAAIGAAPPAAEPGSTVRPLFNSPEDFVEKLRPLAREAAGRLGLKPDVLLAQAALETGWGQRMTRDAQGSSLNLFNIKAGSQWQGRTVSVSTVEYRDGLAQRETARFRAYDSFAESFRDYVELISESPRYRQALERATDPQGYLGELQDAGYATDPDYADKIMNILERAAPEDQFSG